MEMSLKIRSSILLFLLLFLPIYQDSPFSIWFGAGGHFFMMPLSIFFFILTILLNKRDLSLNKYMKKILFLCFWILVVGIASVSLWMLLGNSIYYLNENLIIKNFKVFLQFFSFSLYVYTLFIYISIHGLDKVYRYAFYTTIVLSVLCIIEMYQTPYAFSNMHFTGEIPYYRIRLLTLESSMTGMLILNYTGLAFIHMLKDNSAFTKFATLLCFFILYTSTESKTLLLTIPIFGFIYIVLYLKKLTIRRFVLSILLVALFMIFSYLTIPKLTEYIYYDLVEYTSIATRSYTMFVGFVLGIVFPIGVGGSMYLPLLQEGLKRFLWMFDALPIRLNIAEILSLAYSGSSTFVSVKSGLLQYNIYWGIIGTLYFFNISRQMIVNVCKLNSTEFRLLLSLYICDLIHITLSSAFCFEFWIIHTMMMYTAMAVNNKKVPDNV